MWFWSLYFVVCGWCLLLILSFAGGGAVVLLLVVGAFCVRSLPFVLYVGGWGRQMVEEACLPLLCLLNTTAHACCVPHPPLPPSPTFPTSHPHHHPAPTSPIPCPTHHPTCTHLPPPHHLAYHPTAPLTPPYPPHLTAAHLSCLLPGD